MNSLQPEKNDVVRLTIMGGSELLGVSMPQLDEDLPYTHYVNDLVDAFMD